MDDGKVIPFGRPAKTAAPELPADQRRLHRRTQQAAPGARKLAAEQAAARGELYSKAARQQREEKLLAEGRPVPARITIALNLGGHEGPEVDLAVGTFEGNLEGDVDAWERGDAVPSAEQVRLLSQLTGFGLRYFYEPIEPGEFTSPLFLCGRGGCQIIRSWVDERGVLHYDEEEPDPAAAQGALFGAAPEVPKKQKTRRRPAERPAEPVAEQPTLPTSGRMPAALRAELMAKLGSRKP